MIKKFKELLAYNLSDFLFMCAITFLFLGSEAVTGLLMIRLMSTIGFLGFLITFSGMLFIGFMYLFIMVSIWENL